MWKKERREQEHKQLTSLNVIQMVDPFWSFPKHTTPTLNTYVEWWMESVRKVEGEREKGGGSGGV